MTAEDGFVEIGTISLPEMMEFLERQSDDVVITGAGQLPSGLWFAFLRIYGSTVILNDQCSEEQAERILRAATVFTDLLDTVFVEQGGEVTNELPLAKEIFDIAQWPDSTS